MNTVAVMPPPDPGTARVLQDTGLPLGVRLIFKDWEYIVERYNEGGTTQGLSTHSALQKEWAEQSFDFFRNKFELQLNGNPLNAKRPTPQE